MPAPVQGADSDTFQGYFTLSSGTTQCTKMKNLPLILFLPLTFVPNAIVTINNYNYREHIYYFALNCKQRGLTKIKKQKYFQEK